jgi:hypothetical protein
VFAAESALKRPRFGQFGQYLVRFVGGLISPLRVGGDLSVLLACGRKEFRI